jgi:hypothetical protein
MNYSKLTAIAALATSILAGSMTAAINDQNRLIQQGLDPMIIEILQRAEAGTLPEQFKPKTRKGLKQRVLDRSKKPALGVRRDDTRLQLKFADELQVRIKDDGTVISRTNRSISDITSLIEDFELILTPAIPASEERIDALMSRAQHHSRKQTPDIGGMYWVDGTSSAVSAAASVFHGMDDVEWVFWNTIMDPTKHTSDRASIFSELHQQETGAMLAAANAAADAETNTVTNQKAYITGACLLDDRTCEPDVTSDTCRALAGTYLGDSSICKINDGEERLLPIGACCLILIGGAPTGVLGVTGCLDQENDGISFAQCLAITPGSVFSNAFALNTHANGVWFDGEDCAGITADCLAPPAGAFVCGDLSDPATIFSGDCYHNQADPAQTWENRFVNGAGLPGTPGCWDAPGYPNLAPTPATTGTAGDLQGLCDAIIEIDPFCGTTMWDDVCASYALSSEFVGNGIALNPPATVAPELSGLSGDCASPWGLNFRPIPVNTNGTLGTQPMVVLTAGVGGGPVRRTVTQGLTVFDYGCGSNPAGTALPGLPTRPLTAATPDFGPELTAGLGLQQHLTDEPLLDVATPTQAVAVVADPSLLAWPMGGAQVGDLTINTIYAAVSDGGTGLPISGRAGADNRWSGTGLNLFADFTANSGIGNGNSFGGLYGLGFRKQVETGVANGTHGAGVKVAVLDYAAYIQTYLVDTTLPPDGILETLIGGLHEDLSVDSDGADAQGTSVPTAGVLLEGIATGHTPIKMLFNPPDTNDFPFDFPQSPNHGTAQLGVIAASWGVPGSTGNAPSNATPPTAGTNFGVMGIAPQATTAFFPLMDNDQSGGGGTGGRVETAWFNAMEWLNFGDVLSAGYVELDNGGTFANVAFNPSVHSLIETATNLGISVVIAAGDSGADLTGSEYPNGIDPGAISVCATTPGGAPAKRWADSNTSSNFVEGAIDTSRNTCSAWGMGVVTCGMGPAQDNLLGFQTIAYTTTFPSPAFTVDVHSRSYTNNYGGTSAAAAIVAGCVASVQGYSRQLWGTPIGPTMLRHFIAHGQVLGNDPDTGEAIFSNINSNGTDQNVLQSTENNLGTSAWPAIGSNGFDMEGVGGGAGNIVGYFADPRYACLRTTVDPIFDHPNIGNILVVRGTLLEGNINSIASIDGVYFGVNSAHTSVGEYDLPATVPGGSVFYNFYGEVTDVYFTGVAVDPRGDPLLSLKRMTLDVELAPTQAPATILQLWMWDFSQGRWIQPSATGVLQEGATEQDFEIVRSGFLLDDGTYHARLVSITGAGPFNRLPIYYDQIRIIPTIPGTTP